MLEWARHCFLDQFGVSADWVVRAPGRVNIIGDHVDYNGGLVLPIGIGYSTVLAAKANAAYPPRVRVYSEPLDRRAEFSLVDLHPSETRPWWSYLAGVADSFQSRSIHSLSTADTASRRRPEPIPSIDMAIVSDLPVGAGLSSSAALSVAWGTLLDALLATGLSSIKLARVCRDSEHRYAGVPCGIMDPLCIAACVAGHGVLIDCASETHELVPWGDGEVELLVADTGVRRALGDGRYEMRRRECRQAASALNAASLRDVSPPQLADAEEMLDRVLFRRAKHVVEEIDRVRRGMELVRNKRWRDFGSLMTLSHESLRDLFEVSSPELDAMVEISASLDGVFGSRMTGGGFGGCTVSLVEAGSAELIANQMVAEYRQRTGLPSHIMLVRPSDGARILQRPG